MKMYPPRAGGAFLLLMGLLVSALAVWEVFYWGKYHMKVVVLAPTVTMVGLYSLVVGRPIDPETGDVEQWAKVGVWVAGGVGVAAGIVFLVLLSA
jgi:hypothetical protein